ncbi:unnamed protein product [Macrosiphum euphorbiae]|uniref:Uncharacterized protein n=1 Tax=Macrosiphum euphorbiae TaxID=13131 RepID=A0AAV0WYG6_9HEMI|nr:unnamed protein product [Macrosiphum euphorbiae]
MSVGCLRSRRSPEVGEVSGISARLFEVSDIPMRRVGKLAGPDVWRTGGGGTPSGQPDPTYDINPRKVEADR